MIATSLSDYISPSLLKDIPSCLSAQGLSVVIHATENSIRREREILQQLLLEPPAGILIEGCKTALPDKMELHFISPSADGKTLRGF